MRGGRAVPAHPSARGLPRARALLLEMPLPFPPECPPDDAAPKPGKYYRLAQRGLAVGAETTDLTWRRPYETRGGDLYRKPELVEAHGISVFGEVEELRGAVHFTPWMRGKSVAEVTIAESDGHLLNTPTLQGDSHHDWWTKPHDLAPVGVVVEVLEEVA